MPDPGDTAAGDKPSGGGKPSGGPGGPNGPNSGPSQSGGGGKPSGGPGGPNGPNSGPSNSGGGGGGGGGGNSGPGGPNGPNSGPSQNGGGGQGQGGQNNGTGGGRGPGGPNGPNSGGLGQGGQGGQSTAGGKGDRPGNTSGVGGPGGGGGMGAGNARNGSSTVGVGPASGYSAPGNIGGGRNPQTGRMEQGQSPAVTRTNDRIDAMKMEMDARMSRMPNMDMARQTAAQMAQQYGQYRAPPGAAPQMSAMRDPQAASFRTSAPPTNDLSRITQDPEVMRAVNADGVRKAMAAGRSVATPVSVSDLFGESIPRDPSINGRNAASKYNYSGYDLRGLTGPLGEPRTQPTPYGTNYQTAQMLRADYPKSMGRYDQTRLTQALDEISQALPGEADLNRYGNVANPMNNLGRVSLNQMIGGYSPEKAVRALDTTGLRDATEGFQNPGPTSMGMTDRWADLEAGVAAQTRAAQAIQDALQMRGVSPQAAHASNFVAEGTRLPRGVSPVGAPVNGTQYGTDRTWGDRIENRNVAAGWDGITSGSSSFAGGYSDGDGPSFSGARTDSDPQPASYSDVDSFRATASGSYTSPFDTPNVQSAGPFGPTDYQRYSTVGGGLGMTAFNPNPDVNPDTLTNFSREKFSKPISGRGFYGGRWSSPQQPSPDDGTWGPRDDRAPPSGQSYADDGTWGPRDDRDPLGNWSAPAQPASDDEGVEIGVEDVPNDVPPSASTPPEPEYVDPITGVPPEQLPEKTIPEKFLEHVPYVKYGVGLLRGLTEWDWGRLTPEQRADVMRRWTENQATYGRYGDSLGGQQNENPVYALYGGGNNAYVPQAAIPPQAPAPPPADDNEWDTNRRRQYTDPYGYGFGPGFNYFTYE